MAVVAVPGILIVRGAIAVGLLALAAGLCAPPAAGDEAPNPARAPVGAPAAAKAFPRVAILCYHDVADDPDASPLTVTAAFLRDQIRASRANGWTILSLSELLKRREHPETLPRKVMVLTFDDGYRSFTRQALPVLREAGVCPTLSVISSFVDAPPDDLPGLLNWDELRRLDASGEVELASHSHALHRYETSNPAGDTAPAGATRLWLPELRRYEDREEYRNRIDDDLDEAQVALKQNLGRTLNVLAWPYGAHNEMARGQAARVGFATTLSLESRAVSPADLAAHCLPRVMVTQYIDFRDSTDGWLAPPNDPVRAAELDLDAIWSADEGVFRARLDQAVTRLTALGATDVILAACAAPHGNGRVVRSWAMNHQLPMRADVWSLVAAKLAAADFKVWLRAPSMNLSWAWDRHPEWRLHGRAQGPGVAAWRTRLSPELPGVRAAAADFYTDLAVYLPLEGVVFDDDAFVTLEERLASDPARTRADAGREIRALLEGCKQAVRAWRPECRFARVLSPGVLDRTGVDVRVAQEYEESLAYDDLTLFDLRRVATGAAAEPVLRVARRAVARAQAVAARAHELPVLLMMPAVDARRRAGIPEEVQLEIARAVVRAGVRHIGTGPVAAEGPLPFGLLEVTPAPPAVHSAGTRR